MTWKLVGQNDQGLFVKLWTSKHLWSKRSRRSTKLLSCAAGSAFFDLCPRIAEANGSIEHQLLPGVAVNAVVTKPLKLILAPTRCVSHTRLYFAVAHYLQ